MIYIPRDHPVKMADIDVIVVAEITPTGAAFRSVATFTTIDDPRPLVEPDPALVEYWHSRASELMSQADDQ